MSVQLSLYEELFLLNIHRKGVISLSDRSFSAALLADLIFRGHVTLDTKSRTFGRTKDVIRVIRGDNTGDALLDEFLHLIAKKNDAKEVSRWIREFARKSGGKNRIGERLISRGIVRKEKRHLLSKTHYYAMDERVSTEIAGRVRSCVANGGGGDGKVLVLMAILMDGDELGKSIGEKLHSKDRKRVKAICESDSVAKAIMKALKQLKAEDRAAVSSAVSAGGAVSSGGAC